MTRAALIPLLMFVLGCALPSPTPSGAIPGKVYLNWTKTWDLRRVRQITLKSGDPIYVVEFMGGEALEIRCKKTLRGGRTQCVQQAFHVCREITGDSLSTFGLVAEDNRRQVRVRVMYVRCLTPFDFGKIIRPLSPMDKADDANKQ